LKRITIFTGHFGSGKTEIAVNHTLNLCKAGEKVSIVDLDIVNPFFRSSEVRDVLEREGARVISPVFAVTNVDIPSLPAEIYSVFQNREGKVVFDVGGDDTGAVALGRFTPYFRQEGYDMLYVINAKRPLSSTPEDIIEMLAAIESNSRLKVTGLINNTNLAKETSVQDILEGQAVVEEVARRLNLPIRMISGKKELLDRLPEEMRAAAFPIKRFMKPLWEEE